MYKIGMKLATFGAQIWDKHGYDSAAEYKDLPFIGKVGYNIFCEGIKMAFGDKDFAEKIARIR